MLRELSLSYCTSPLFCNTRMHVFAPSKIKIPPPIRRKQGSGSPARHVEPAKSATTVSTPFNNAINNRIRLGIQMPDIAYAIPIPSVSRLTDNANKQTTNTSSSCHFLILFYANKGKEESPFDKNSQIFWR